MGRFRRVVENEVVFAVFILGFWISTGLYMKASYNYFRLLQ